MSQLDAADGTFRWTNYGGSNGIDRSWGGLAVDSNGGVYITGAYYGDTADFGNDTLIRSGSNELEGFISKLDVNGSFLWAKSFGGTGSDEGMDVALDSTGNLLAVGSYGWDTPPLARTLDLSR